MNVALTQKKSSVTYINSLTPMRGIAALWVMLFHIDVSLFYRDVGAILSRDQTGILSKGYLWVDFFFLLSGFVIAHAYSHQLQSKPYLPAIKYYLVARWARIYPLHFFTLFVLVIITPLVAFLFPSVVDGSWKTYFAWSALPSNLLLTQSMNQHVYLSWNIVSWSIGAEWWTYVLSIPCLIFLSKRGLPFTTVFALCFFGLLSALVFNLPARNLDITFNYGFWRCLFEFNIGLALYQFFLYRKMESVLSRDWVSYCLMLAIIVIFHFRLNDLLIIPCFGLLILSLAYNDGKMANMLNLPVFQYLGKTSYSIYMVHSLWFMVFWFSLPQIKSHWFINEFSAIQKILYIVLFVSFTLLSSHFTYHLIEVKARRWIMSFFNSAKAK